MNNPRALIVEDDKDVAELYSRVLATLGFEAETTRTGEAALGRLAVIAPEVVLLDLSLPSHVSGKDIVQQIRADKRLIETRVIVITGHPDLADTVRDEADAVFFKPVDISQLSDTIARLRKTKDEG